MTNYRATIPRPIGGLQWATPDDIRAGLAIPVAFRALRELALAMPGQ